MAHVPCENRNSWANPSVWNGLSVNFLYFHVPGYKDIRVLLMAGCAHFVCEKLSAGFQLCVYS